MNETKTRKQAIAVLLDKETHSAFKALCAARGKQMGKVLKTYITTQLKHYNKATEHKA